jgi:hypothetical protein
MLRALQGQSTTLSQGLSLKGGYLWQPRAASEATRAGTRFERPGVFPAQREVATTGGVNVWLAKSRIQLLAN